VNRNSKVYVNYFLLKIIEITWRSIFEGMETSQVKTKVSDYRKRLQKLEKDNEKLEAELIEREAIMANLFSFIEGNFAKHER